MALNVTTKPATDVYLDSATLNGELVDIADFTEASVLFSVQEKSVAEWQDTISGTIPYSGTLTETQTLTEEAVFAYTTDDIEPDTSYEFRAIAEAGAELTQGEVREFTTQEYMSIYTSPELVNFVFNGAREKPQDLNGKERLAVHNIALRHVDPIINTKLSQRYDVPFSAYPDAPAIVTDISTKLTVYYFVNFPGGSSAQYQYIEELKNQAMDMLNGIVDGELSIHDDPLADNFDFDRLMSESSYDKLLFVGHLQPPHYQTEFGDSAEVFRNR